MTKKSDRRIKRWMTALFQGRFSGLMEKNLKFKLIRKSKQSNRFEIMAKTVQGNSDNVNSFSFSAKLI